MKISIEKQISELSNKTGTSSSCNPPGKESCFFVFCFFLSHLNKVKIYNSFFYCHLNEII